ACRCVSRRAGPDRQQSVAAAAVSGRGSGGACGPSTAVSPLIGSRPVATAGRSYCGEASSSSAWLVPMSEPPRPPVQPLDPDPPGAVPESGPLAGGVSDSPSATVSSEGATPAERSTQSPSPGCAVSCSAGAAWAGAASEG